MYVHLLVLAWIICRQMSSKFILTTYENVVQC
jgi:hypothetical protein